MRVRNKTIIYTIVVLATVPFALLVLDILKSRIIKGYISVGHRRKSLHLYNDLVPGIDKVNDVKKGDEGEFVTSTKPISETCQNIKKCNPTKPGMLNVHFVPHSHLDVGWKKTVDQYYTGDIGGNNQSFYEGPECTKCVFDSILTQLAPNSTRRFIVAEIAFFSRWFHEQTLEIQEIVRQLIHSRRLEFVTGGWCVSDSANTYYDDIIDQHTVGFQWIEREFGECALSHIGWHIDQFGHSREHSSLFAQMGFDAVFLGRIDFQDQERRIKTRNMETIWKGSPGNLGDKSSLFTSVLYDGYFSPSGLGWEGIEPAETKEMQDNEVNKLLTTALKWAESYKTNNILIPFGGDFAFSSAYFWYEGLDQLIRTVNDQQQNGSMVNALYSTPSCYIHSVNEEGAMFETMTTDFFPYSTIPNTFWTGFYTSRPGLKRHVKVASSLLQTCRQLSVLARSTQVSKDIAILNKAVGLLQHHDAITGTEMQHVTDDYNRMLSEGELSCQFVISTAYRTLLPDSERENFPSQHFCDHLNISFCKLMETSNKLVITLFNPLGQTVTHWVRLPIVSHPHVVHDPSGEEVQTQALPVPDSTQRIPERRSASTQRELVFKVILPPVGFATYRVSRGEENIKVPPKMDSGSYRFSIANKILSLTLDPASGLTKTLTNLINGVEIELEQNYLYYISSEGQERNPADQTGGFLGSHKRPSGAYVFSPKENINPIILKGPNTDGVQVKIHKGANVQEIHQVFSPWVSQVIRLYDGAPYLEMEWTVGPIPERLIDIIEGTMLIEFHIFSKNESKDVVSRFTSDLTTGAVLYTDSNGRENIKRHRNTRETWNLTVTNPVSGNYYPVTARMFIRDTKRNLQLTLLTDRSQGGASLKDGEMEIMVHRRTFKDDDMGVNEPLNETGVDGQGLIVRGTHYLFLDTIDKSPQGYRPFGLQIHHPPTLSFMRVSRGVTDKVVKSFSGLRTPLPHNVHLVTLDRTGRDPDTLLIRLENYYEKGETPGEVDEEATVELQHMFIDFDITTVRELSLGANHNITRVRRLQWKAKDGTVTPAGLGSKTSRDVLSPPFRIRLRPMEIRTFRVTTGPTSKPRKRFAMRS